ncbi:MAG TPA: HDIG domain-containing protein [Roseiflexaceae bacterium]|nr:HDIG domain-containing protein [Roseiflexaceae bacterium]
MRMLTFPFQRGRRETRAATTPADRRRGHLYHLGAITALLALALWMILAMRPPTVPVLQPDLPSPISIQAPRTVTFESEIATEQERVKAESAPTTLVYQRLPNVLTEQRKQLASLLQTITQIRNDPSLDASAKQQKLEGLPSSTIVISPSLASKITSLTSDQWSSVQQRSLFWYDRAMEKYGYELDDQAVMELRDRSIPYWSRQEPTDVQAELVRLFGSAFIKPNRVLDEEATRQRKKAARDSVKPVIVQLLAGENIVRAGEKITPEIEEKLEAIGIIQPQNDWKRFISSGILACLVAATFGLYIGMGAPNIWQADRPLLVVNGLIAVTLLLARILLPLITDWTYVFPLAMTSMLLAALFSRGLAVMAAALLSLLIMYVGNGQIDSGASLLIGSLAGIFAIGRPQRTLTFLGAGGIIAVVTALTQFALALPNFIDITSNQILPILIVSSLNGVLSAILALSLYNILGNLAGMATPFQLMELAHPSQPLLRKLMREAPGTYYHSIAVGNLAESAAEAIGADALLLRVAAYYHDIGKSIRPYFFTDNQSDRENVHNDLDPQTSAEIIADHVREGVNMARAAGLPRQLYDFISTHHGTSIIRHFYQVALQQEDTVNVERFRYPGPKPQTREQAILMLADTVEATVRSKAQYGKLLSSRSQMNGGTSNGDKQTLEEMVTSIIDERVRSGQLDESALTLQDIARIRQAFITTLQGIYHPRVEYAPQIIK